MISSRFYKAEAIVLKRRNIGEADKVFTLFTKEYGKLGAIAKGVRRITSKRAPHLEVFTQVALMIHQGKTWDMVTDAQALERFGALRKDLRRVSVAYYLCELVDRLLPEKQEHRDIFVLLRKALEKLDRSNDVNIHQMIDDFSHTLLIHLGFLSGEKIMTAPELESYIEHILEKRLRTPKIFRQLL